MARAAKASWRTRSPRRRVPRKPGRGNSDRGVLSSLRDLRDRMLTLATTTSSSSTTMVSTLAPQVLVGWIFGAALLLSGVGSPATIVKQFKLTDFHMLVAFLTASSASAVVVYLANRTGYARLASRSCSDYGWLSMYGGNIAGGVMQGIGMAVSGACPGTVLVQVVMGWGRGLSVMGGCVLGGALFIVFGDRLRVKRARVEEVKTFQEKLGVSTESMVVLYEVVMGSVIALTSMFAPMGIPWFNALVGGCLIGGAQASSVLFSGKTLGISTAYQDVAGHVVGLIDGSRQRPGWNSIVFAAGVMGGVKVTSQYVTIAVPTLAAEGITTGAAVLGGVLSIFGARLAGGCTSGHGISGCSTMSISSMITVASIFGGGIAFKMLSG